MELIEYNGIGYIFMYPNGGPRPKVDMSRPKQTHNGASCVENYTVWKHDWKHESLDIGNFDCTKVWKWVPSVWDGLDMDMFRLGRSGYIGFQSGTSTWVATRVNFFLLSSVSGLLWPKNLCKYNCSSWFRSRRVAFIWICNPHPIYFPTPWQRGEHRLFLLRWHQKWIDVWLVQKTRCMCGTVLDL